jgi:glutamate carboxypeptidase
MAAIQVDDQALLDWIGQQRTRLESTLLELVGINSGTHNREGVNLLGTHLNQLMHSTLGVLPEQVELDPWQQITLDGQAQEKQLGMLCLARKRPEAPVQLLLCGHLDTVFQQNSPFQHAAYLDEHTLNAPGAADMKGGILVMLTALHALEQHPLRDQVGWTVLLNPDEEIGSPGSAGWLALEARRHHLALLYEPALPDNTLAGARKGSGNFTLVINGRSAHAGRNPEAGRNAICAAADAVAALNALNAARPGLTLNVGLISGGETTNQVPDRAVIKFNVRIQQAEDAGWCLHRLEDIQLAVNQRDGFSAHLHGSFGRMPKQLDARHQQLYALAQQCGNALQLDIHWQPTGGCCDGNNLSNHGLPNVDTLGVRGGMIHSEQEFICLDSLTERAQLSALMLFHLARYGVPFADTETAKGGQHER